VDRTSQRLFSTSTFQIGWQPYVTSTVSNAAVAPQGNGPWSLQLNLYIFEEAGEVASFSHLFNIQVGNTVVNAQQTTSAIVSTSAGTGTMANQKTASLETNPGTTGTSFTGTESMYIAVALAIATIVGAAILVKTRKRTT
jgi:hypothetical protein